MLEWIKKYQPTLAAIGAVIAILGVTIGYRQFLSGREAARANAYLTMKHADISMSYARAGIPRWHRT